MQKTLPIVGDPLGRDEVTCEPFGYTIDASEVWWIPQTKEKFVLSWDEFRPYDGPVVHGTGYTF